MSSMRLDNIVGGIEVCGMDLLALHFDGMTAKALHRHSAA
jgi:hypothetical protein